MSAGPRVRRVGWSRVGQGALTAWRGLGDTEAGSSRRPGAEPLPPLFMRRVRGRSAASRARFPPPAPSPARVGGRDRNSVPEGRSERLREGGDGGEPPDPAVSGPWAASPAPRHRVPCRQRALRSQRPSIQAGRVAGVLGPRGRGRRAGHPPRTLLQRLHGGFSLRAIHGGRTGGHSSPSFPASRWMPRGPRGPRPRPDFLKGGNSARGHLGCQSLGADCLSRLGAVGPPYVPQALLGQKGSLQTFPSWLPPSGPRALPGRVR